MDIETYKQSGPVPIDLIVLPETWLYNAPQYFQGIPKVIFNQNAFYSFGLNGDCNSKTIELYQHSDIHAVVTVSNDSRDLLVEGCGVEKDRCAVLINGIDDKLFHPPHTKHRRVVFLGRKHADHARKVALMATQNERLKSISFHEIGQMQHHEIANALKESLIYLSCGHPEGFGLPLAEAIACGCLVVGYHGLAGATSPYPTCRWSNTEICWACSKALRATCPL